MNPDATTLRKWRRRQNIFLAVIVAAFVLIGITAMQSSSAQTPATQPAPAYR